YTFKPSELQKLVDDGVIPTKRIEAGPARGEVFVQRQACVRYREQNGYSESEAARKAGVTIARLRQLLRGVNWRGRAHIPLVTVQAVIKRLQSREGLTVPQAAEVLDATEA